MDEDRDKLKVLVADDMRSMRALIKASLKDLGFSRIDEAADGEMAKKAISSGEFDLVICDWDMPHANGLEVLEHTRTNAKNTAVPFIMLTANNDVKHVKQAIEAGVSDYIAKPFKPVSLSTKVDRLLADSAEEADADVVML